MSQLNDILAEIKSSHKQVSSSQKDEVRIMKAMLNDTDYKVGIYDNKNGFSHYYSPSEDFRKMQSNIVASATSISKNEAELLMKDYEVTNTDAASMVNISKEWSNTYLLSGRKLAFGGREKSNFALSIKEVPETKKVYQRKVIHPDGSTSWEPDAKTIPAHLGIRAKSSCPKWVNGIDV